MLGTKHCVVTELPEGVTCQGKVVLEQNTGSHQGGLCFVDAL